MDFSRRQFLKSSTVAALPAFGCTSKSTVDVAPPNGDEIYYGDAFDAFTTKLYGVLPERAANCFISPMSIGVALSMTAEGARNKTLAEMKEVLSLPPGEGVCEALAKKTMTQPVKADRGYDIAVANSLWPQSGYPWNDAYMKTVTETFHAEVKPTDFTGNPEGSRLAINAWVEEQTRQKIKELLEPEAIDPKTRLVLVNAIYFKGDWSVQFDKTLTREQDFTKLDRTKKRVPLMHRTGKFEYFQDKEIQAIRLPYKSNELSLLAVLPQEPARFSEIDSKLDALKFNQWAAAVKPMNDVEIWLPRFRIESTYKLNEPLVKLGMVTAFQYGVADFSGMTPAEKLFISLVIHKSYVEVNEEGTEAAAATGVVIYGDSARPLPPRFVADRPFWFAIRHDATNTILFMGRCTAP